MTTTPMLPTYLLGLALVLGITSPAFAAKILVFCSAASPEGFNPQFYTAGITCDASSRTLYNRLVQFTPGTTRSEA